MSVTRFYERALFVAGDGRPGDAVLVNAVIGAKRLGVLWMKQF